MSVRLRLLVAALALAVPTAASAQSARLVEVARFDHQVTGVTVTPTGRIFVNFPRWSEDAPVSVAEVVNGRAVPYPDAGWNSWRNVNKNQTTPGDHFVCVQSVVADKRGNLWVLDPAAPNAERTIKGGPKLVRIDLATNRVAQVIALGEDVAPPSSYMNDVRFAPDGRTAYITDSGKGALVVVDLASGRARRVLDGDSSTQLEKDVVVKTDGRPLRRPDGRGPEFNADGIALSPDGSRLYWQALTGRTLYSIATADLTAMPASALPSRVRREGVNGVADGLEIDARGTMYVTAPEADAVKVRRGGQVTTLVHDARLRWPDTMSVAADGTVYVTASHIQDSAWFKPEQGPRLPTALFKIEQAR